MIRNLFYLEHFLIQAFLHFSISGIKPYVMLHFIDHQVTLPSFLVKADQTL